MYVSIYLSVRLPIYIYVFIHLSINLVVYLSIYVPLIVYLSTRVVVQSLPIPARGVPGSLEHRLLN